MYDAIVKFFVIASKILALIFPLLVDDLRASEVSPCPPQVGINNWTNRHATFRNKGVMFVSDPIELANSTFECKVIFIMPFKHPIGIAWLMISQHSTMFHHSVQ